MRENTMYENTIAVTTGAAVFLQAAEKNRCRDGKKTRRCRRLFLEPVYGTGI